MPDPRTATLLEIFRTAVAAVAAERRIPKRLPRPRGGRLLLIAAGKAAADSVRVLQARGDAPAEGLVVSPYGHVPADFSPNGKLELIEAGHPVPDLNSLRAARRALEIASALGAEDRLLLLLSGGGSALLAAPAAGVSLAEKQELTRRLLRCGASIAEVNAVRKHLSRIKGGRLALAAAPAPVTTWIISDVPGDDPATVASGPSLPDTSTLTTARAVLERYSIEPPTAVAAALADPSNETPAPGTFPKGEMRILARAADALAAAARAAESRGYRVVSLGDRLQDEARDLARAHAALARRAGDRGRPHLLLSGGEARVTVTNPAGRGGRNLEYLLALVIALGGAPSIAALACDTDGIDGTGDAAGAVVLPDTLERACGLGLSAEDHLARNDAYSFFRALGDLVVTGPTFTNVNDFRAILVDPVSAPE